MAEQKVIKYAELSAECDISVTEALRRYFVGQAPAQPVEATKPEENAQRRKEDDSDH